MLILQVFLAATGANLVSSLVVSLYAARLNRNARDRQVEKFNDAIAYARSVRDAEAQPDVEA